MILSDVVLETKAQIYFISLFTLILNLFETTSENKVGPSSERQ